MKTESIKFARWLLKDQGIEPECDIDLKYEEYDFKTKPRNYGMVYINFHVAAFFDVDSEWLREKGRRRPKVQSRQIAQYIMKEFKHDETAIAGFYHQDRSNIYNSIDTVKNLIETDIHVAANVHAIMRMPEFNLGKKY